MKDLKEKTIRGGFAKLGAQVAGLFIRFGSLVVLARLLDPKDFGLVGMVTAVTGIFGLFKDVGLSLVTVQRASITNEQISTLFWINILVGAMLGLLSLAIAPVLVSLYHEPRLFWVAAVLGIAFLFNAAGVQHAAILQRELRFGGLAVIEIVSLLVSSAIGIGMAFSGYGYWALVGMAISLPIVSTIYTWLMTAWVPGAPVRDRELSSMIRFGGVVTLNGLVSYFSYNLEKVLLGRFWGAESLGMYGRAYQLCNFPTEGINSTGYAVAFSALSRLQNDPTRFKAYFLKGYSLTVTLTAPISAACALFANDIVAVVLGPKWEDAAQILRLLTPTIMVFALLNPMGWMLNSLGKVERSLNMALVIAPIVMLGYLLGLPYGPVGVAVGYSVTMVGLCMPMIAWAIKGTIVSFRDIWQAVRSPIISTIIAAAIASCVAIIGGQIPSPFPRLMIGGGVLTLAYLWMLLYVMGERGTYVNLFQSLTGRVD
jgi:PST family polysaccharide transporter